jgi:Tol biopolymer transport system component
MRNSSRSLPALVGATLLGLAAACGGDDDPGADSLVAVDDAVTIDEDALILVDVLANDSDADGRPLVLRRASAEGREVTIEDRRVRVTTEPNWSGTIDVTYVVVAGTDSAAAHAIITVAPVNDAPTARAGTANTGRNHPRPILLQGDDVDDDALTFEIESGPAHGTLSGTPPTITYTPAEGYIGEDAVTFHARDAAVSSAAATIAINVLNGANPVATAQTVTTLEETPRSITLAGTDADNDPLTFEITTQPLHGTLTGAPPNVTYTPAVDYVGQDSFAFTADDGVLTSDPAAVTISVTNVNDPPVAQVQMIAAMEDIAATIVLVGTDTEGSALTYTIVDAPAHGTLSGTGATRTYTPAPNLHGVDSFTFTVSDGMATSSPATVSIVIASVEDAPVATAQSVTTAEDTARSITLTGTDGDGDALTFVVGLTPHGMVTGTPPDVTYTPYQNYNGTDTISFVANDGDQTSAAGTITVTITPVDDTPFVPNAAITGSEDDYIAVPLPATDVDGETLTYSVATFPAHGSIYGTGAQRSYHSVGRYNGNDSFALTASDGHTTSAPATIMVTVTPVADPPLAREDIAIATPGQPLELDVLANDHEFDGEVMHVESVSAPNHGTAETDGEVVTYTPEPGNTAPATFTYTVADSSGLTTTANITIGMGEFPSGMALRFVGMGQWVSSAGSSQQDISADGRYVAFLSHYTYGPGDNNVNDDVYVRDRMTNTYTRVSIPIGGAVANGASERPSISADGRYVAFASAASNLVPGDTNGAVDVFVRDLVAGTTVRASVSSTGAQVNGISRDPDISADGKIVAFTSTAFELIPSDANGMVDVFVRDLDAGTTSRVSIRTGGGEADQPSTSPALSGDGRVVAFISQATNLIAGDTNSRIDVFVHDRMSGVTERVSVSSTGGEANQSSSIPTVSYDGRFVAFDSSANNLAPGVGVGGTVYIRDRQAITTLPLGFRAQGLSLSGDGRYLVGHTSNSYAFVRDRFASQTFTFGATANDYMYFPVISRNGRYVVLLSERELDNQSHSSGSKVFVYPNPL